MSFQHHFFSRDVSVFSRRRSSLLVSSALTVTLSILPHGVQAQDASAEGETQLSEITITAADQLKQMPGVSTITAEDLTKAPVANDIAEIIRKMPGVNFTSNSSTGQRGNQRQIDLRGMGPENTLILIDGKPVLSRDSVRMGRGGDRDSRGDTNWVPMDAIDHIEVLRGPAAARYGSGAAGGVVNIITKKPTKLTTTVSIYGELPQHSDEGKTFRTTITSGGPITDRVSFFLSGNYNRTSPDAYDINSSVSGGGINQSAGREGVVNKDLRGRLTFDIDGQNSVDVEAGYSRQGNLYAGDTQLSILKGEGATYVPAYYGKETNSLTRYDLSVTHRGDYDFGSSLSYLQWERTLNRRLGEGLTGGVEGAINTDSFSTIQLNNFTGKTEWNFPFTLGVEQTATLGGEFRGEYMHDPVSNSQDTGSVSIPGTESDASNRDPDSDSWDFGFYGEDNIQLTDQWTMTPGLRFDYDTSFGTNWSPSLNTSYDITDDVTLKAGIARAFKAPNLFQLNPNYVYKSSGNGCPLDYSVNYGGYSSDNGCYVVGNPDLDAETSWNSEIGINYHNDDGWNAGLTYFHNDYHNKIQAGTEAYGGDGDYYYFKWDNIPRAVVAGLEGNLQGKLTEQLAWSLNGTYMLESKNKSDSQPLSLVPKYTLNASLDWQARDNLSLVLSGTYYGKISAATVNSSTGKATDSTLARKAYGIVNLGAVYTINEKYTFNLGVKNIFDQRLLRSNEGANTYNEAGRTFYAGIKATF